MTLIELKKSVDAALAAGEDPETEVLHKDDFNNANTLKYCYVRTIDGWGRVFIIKEES